MVLRVRETTRGVTKKGWTSVSSPEDVDMMWNNVVYYFVGMDDPDEGG